MVILFILSRGKRDEKNVEKGKEKPLLQERADACLRIASPENVLGR